VNAPVSGAPIKVSATQKAREDVVAGAAQTVRAPVSGAQMRLSATQKSIEDARNMDAAKNMLKLSKQTPQEHLHRKVAVEQLPTGKVKDVAVATKPVGIATKHLGTNSTAEEKRDETDTRKAEASACQKQPRKLKAPEMVRAMVELKQVKQ
jgi:hypothetical protein